jgi:hypothetical protein
MEALSETLLGAEEEDIEMADAPIPGVSHAEEVIPTKEPEKMTKGKEGNDVKGKRNVSPTQRSLEDAELLASIVNLAEGPKKPTIADRIKSGAIPRKKREPSVTKKKPSPEASGSRTTRKGLVFKDTDLPKGRMKASERAAIKEKLLTGAVIHRGPCRSSVNLATAPRVPFGATVRDKLLEGVVPRIHEGAVPKRNSEKAASGPKGRGPPEIGKNRRAVWLSVEDSGDLKVVHPRRPNRAICKCKRQDTPHPRERACSDFSMTQGTSEEAKAEGGKPKKRMSKRASQREKDTLPDDLVLIDPNNIKDVPPEIQEKMSKIILGLMEARNQISHLGCSYKGLKPLTKDKT